ncbi:MAG: TadE family protein [Planctomycetota bacterium]
MNTKSSSRNHPRRGAVVVEFAITIPILFLFFFAAFEFCRVAMIRHTVDNAVYEGCRVAIVPGATASDARTRAESVLGTIGVRSSSISVSPSVIDNDTAEITLTVDVDLDANSFVPGQFMGGSRITRTLSMQRETAL